MVVVTVVRRSASAALLPQGNLRLIAEIGMGTGAMA